MDVENRDLNLILAALFELRLTCVENERTWAAIGNLAEMLGGKRSAMFFGAPAPEVRRLAARMDLNDEERELILAGLFGLTTTYVEGDRKREQCEALVQKLGGDTEAMFFERQVPRDA